jgi:subtilisin family serine protease
VLVQIATGAPATTEDELAQAFALALIERTELTAVGLRLARYRIPDGRAVPQVVASLAADPRAEAPQPNYLYNPQGTSAATAPGAYGALQYGLAKISAPAAHRRSTGRGVTIAVIDTGIDADHPDLAGSVTASYDATDAAASSATPRLASGPHATAIAGIISAHGLTRGIAPDAQLINARAFARTSDGGEQATSYWLMKALDWSMTKGARVVNMSLAGPREPLLAKGIESARTKDVIVVAAAGNGGRKAPPAYPAAYDGVIAVTATDSDDRLYVRANQGQYIALAAPGVDIFTLAPGQAHDVLSGTSMAAAHATGIVALLLQDHPHLSVDAVRRAVTASAVDLGRPGPDEEFGAGRGDAEKALAMIEK